MAAPVSPAVVILMELGWNEAEAKNDVAEGKIDLEGCDEITDASVVALAEHCPGLKEIYLNGCSKITKQQLLRDKGVTVIG